MSPPRKNTPARNQSNRGKPRRPANLMPVPDHETWTFTDVETEAETERTQATDRERVLIRPASDPTALIRSLGHPPLPGGETAAEHYFAVVYERAAALAVALAAASDLLDSDAFGADEADDPLR